MIETLLRIGLYSAGGFTLTLGAVHFFFPILLDFEQALPKEGPPLKPFRLLFIRYATQRSDVHGIAWVMNHAASYVLVSIGLVDLFAAGWLLDDDGRWATLWIAGWWFLRSGSQFYLGKRKGDWLIAFGFASLGVLHLLVALFDG